MRRIQNPHINLGYSEAQYSVRAPFFRKDAASAFCVKMKTAVAKNGRGAQTRLERCSGSKENSGGMTYAPTPDGTRTRLPEFSFSSKAEAGQAWRH